MAAATIFACAPARGSFLADVEAMLDGAATHVPMQEGLLEKIRVCNETSSSFFFLALSPLECQETSRPFAWSGGLLLVHPAPCSGGALPTAATS